MQIANNVRRGRHQYSRLLFPLLARLAEQAGVGQQDVSTLCRQRVAETGGRRQGQRLRTLDRSVCLPCCSAMLVRRAWDGPSYCCGVGNGGNEQRIKEPSMKNAPERVATVATVATVETTHRVLNLLLGPTKEAGAVQGGKAGHASAELELQVHPETGRSFDAFSGAVVGRGQGRRRRQANGSARRVQQCHLSGCDPGPARTDIPAWTPCGSKSRPC